ncbi:MAG: hypothetical protein WBX15_08905 [Thermoanaerobaculia bacterium]
MADGSGAAPSPREALRLANQSTGWLILCVKFGFILAPVAWWRAQKGLRILADVDDTRARGRLRFLRTVAILATLFWLASLLVVWTTMRPNLP